MPTPMDFPTNPFTGQRYTAPNGNVYEWDGYAWLPGYYTSETQQLLQLGDVIGQVRTLLQDTDNSSGQYRNSDDGLVLNFNQGLIEMFKLRPDVFLENNFQLPQYTIGDMDQPISIEQQYIPPLVYYTVGLTLLRDQEHTQDERATMFMTRFDAMLRAPV